MSNKDTKEYGLRDYVLTDTYIEQEVNGIRQRVHMCISFERVHASKFYIGGRSTALIEQAEHEAALKLMQGMLDECDKLLEERDSKIAALEARVKELQDYAQKAEDKICHMEDQLKSERKKREEFYEKAKGFEDLSDTLRSQLVAAEEKLETYGVRVAERVLQMLNAHGYGGTGVYKEVLAALEKKRAALSPSITEQHNLSPGEGN